MDYADGSVHALTMGDSELRMILDAAAERQQLVVVDFSASWCGPCKAMVPVLADLARVHQGRVTFCKVDCEETPRNRQLAQEAAITAFPTFHVYRARQRVAEFRGANRPQLLATIQQQLALLPSGGGGAPGVAAGASSAASVGPPGAMAVALAQALGRVRSSCSFEDFVAAARTLLTFVSNILSNPGDPKYRRIRVSNASFHSKLGCKPGGKECMAALGFQERQEEGGAVLVLEAVPEELPQVKALLEQALPQAGAAAAAAPVVAPSTAGPPAVMGAGGSARPTAGGSAGSSGAAAPAVDAAALARVLAAAMGSGGASGQQPPRQQQQQRLVSGQPAPGGGSGGSSQLGAPGVGGGPARPRVLRVSPQGLARMLERVLLDGGLGQPGSNQAQ